MHLFVLIYVIHKPDEIIAHTGEIFGDKRWEKNSHQTGAQHPSVQPTTRNRVALDHIVFLSLFFFVKLFSFIKQRKPK